MIILVCILVFIWCTVGIAGCNDREAWHEEQRQRHRELMTTRSSSLPRKKKIVHRRFLKDPQGNIIGEEVTEEWE